MKGRSCQWVKSWTTLYRTPWDRFPSWGRWAGVVEQSQPGLPSPPCLQLGGVWALMWGLLTSQVPALQWWILYTYTHHSYTHHTHTIHAHHTLTLWFFLRAFNKVLNCCPLLLSMTGLPILLRKMLNRAGLWSYPARWTHICIHTCNLRKIPVRWRHGKGI